MQCDQYQRSLHCFADFPFLLSVKDDDRDLSDFADSGMCSGGSCWLPVYASEIVTSDDLEAYGDNDNGNQQLALLRSKLLM